jgi:hypothetical protein
LSHGVSKLETLKEIGDAVFEFFLAQEIFKHPYHRGSL